MKRGLITWDKTELPPAVSTDASPSFARNSRSKTCPHSCLLGRLAIQPGPLSHELDALLEPRLDRDSVRGCPDPALRTVAASLSVDQVGDDHRGHPPNLNIAKLRKTTAGQKSAPSIFRCSPVISRYRTRSTSPGKPSIPNPTQPNSPCIAARRRWRAKSSKPNSPPVTRTSFHASN